MRRRRLGRTELLVAEIALGTVELGLDYGIKPVGEDARPDETEATVLLNRALDLGLNLIDTARNYGASEEIIGRALRARRAEYIIATKVPLFQREGLAGEALRQAVTNSVQDSLRALATDVLDIVMVHGPPSGTDVPEGIPEALLSLRERGLVRYLGASVYGEEGALGAIQAGWCDCLQIAYSALDRRPEERLLPAAQASDVGIVARSVLLKGALTHRAALLPDALAALRSAAAIMQALADAAGLGLPGMAYRYALAHPAASTALVGTGRLAELEEVVGFAEAGPLPAGLVEQIRGVTVADEWVLNPFNWEGLL